jgi:G3E family GTPase
MIVTGFLGSGKTTILRTMLQSQWGENAAVLINEFGQVPLDHELLATSSEDQVVLDNGCLCCTLRQDLVTTLKQLYKETSEQGKPIQRLFIETSGLAQLAPIIQTLSRHWFLREHFCLEGVMTIVDSCHILGNLDLYPECYNQLYGADWFVLTKLDALTPSMPDPDQLIAKLQSINQTAPVLKANNGQFDFDQIFKRPNVYRAPANAATYEAWLGWHSYQLKDQSRADLEHVHDERDHTPIRSFSLEHYAPLDDTQFLVFLDMLSFILGDDLLRIKGLIHTANHPGEPYCVHVVQHVLHKVERVKHWDGDRTTKLVLIGRNMTSESAETIFQALTLKPHQISQNHNPNLIEV